MKIENGLPVLRLRALPFLLLSGAARPAAFAFFRTLLRLVVALAGVEKLAREANSAMSTWVDDGVSESAIV